MGNYCADLDRYVQKDMCSVVSRRLVSDVSEALGAEERVLLGHANHKDCADGVPGSHDSDVRGGVHC